MYKKGVENLAANAHSRILNQELLTLTLSSISSELLERIKESIRTDLDYARIIDQLAQGEATDRFKMKDGLLLGKGKIVVGRNEELRMEILTLFHASLLGGYSGSTVTINPIVLPTLLEGVKTSVQEFVRNCTTCQQPKYNRSTTPGLLQPLPVLHAILTVITMDFIIGLPSSNDNEVIFVVVDRLTKYSHFVALAHPFSAAIMPKYLSTMSTS